MSLEEKKKCKELQLEILKALVGVQELLIKLGELTLQQTSLLDKLIRMLEAEKLKQKEQGKEYG